MCADGIDKLGEYFVRFAAVMLILALINLVYKPAFTVAMIVFVLAVGFFYYRNRVVPQIEISTTLLYSLGMFFITMFICALFTSNVKGNFAGAFEQFYLAFPFFMLLALQSLVDVRREIKYSLALAVVVDSIYMGYAHFVLGIWRPGGLLGNPNNDAEMLGLVLPLVLYLLFTSQNLRNRIFWLLVGLLDFGALCITVCRGELVALSIVGSVLGLFFAYHRGRRLFLGILVLVGILACIGVYLYQGRSSSDMERIYVYISALNMWKDYPWFGVGFSAWDDVYIQYVHSEAKLFCSHAHNTYLMFLSCTGIVGTMIFLNVFIQMYRIFLVNIRAHRMYYSVGIAGVSIFLLHAMVDSTYSIRYVTRFIWMMFAVYQINFVTKEVKNVTNN